MSDERAPHAALSPFVLEVIERYRAGEIDAGPSVKKSGLPDWVTGFPFPLHGWPTVVGGETRAEMRRVAVELGRLAKSMPERIFGGDPQRIGAHYGIDPDLVAAMLVEPTGIDGAICRGDFVHTADGFRCVEINLDSCLGGWQLRFFLDMYLEHPWIAEILERSGARYVDPVHELFEHLVGRAVSDGLAREGRIDIAFLMSDERLLRLAGGAFEALAREYRAFLARSQGSLEGELSFARYGDLEMRQGRAALGGQTLQVVVDYEKPTPSPILFRALKAGYLHHYNGPAVFLLRDKRNLALLSEHRDSDLFDARERRLLADHLPWTRTVRPGPTRHRETTVDLERLVIERREELVLKPADGMGGEAVRVGLHTAPEVWQATLDQALASGRWIVQERAVSLPYLFPDDDGELRPHEVVWGLFAFGDRYGGGFLRMVPTDAEGVDGVVNAARGAIEGLLFEVDP